MKKANQIEPVLKELSPGLIFLTLSLDSHFYLLSPRHVNNLATSPVVVYGTTVGDVNFNGNDDDMQTLRAN